MTRPDLEQIDRDALADTRLERDRHREHRHPRCVRAAPDLAARRRFQAGVIDDVNRTKEYTIQKQCPVCRGPVYVPVDSTGETVTCNFATCGAELITRRTIDGVDLDRREPGGAP